MLTILTHRKHFYHSVPSAPPVSLSGAARFLACHSAVTPLPLQRPADQFLLGENVRDLTSTAMVSLLHILTYGTVVSIKAYARGKPSALSQALRIPCLEKVTQTSYLGTDFLLIMTPTYVFLILCLNRRSQSTENVDYKQKSCTQLNN